MSRKTLKQVLKYTLVMLTALVIVLAILQKHSGSSFEDFKDDLRRALYKGPEVAAQIPKVGPCSMEKECPVDQFSFLVQSGAANVIPPKICFKNKLLLGTVMNNAGSGINIVVINGKTEESIKTGHFDMYNGAVEPLIKFLKSIEVGSMVLMASFDDPSTKLSEDARNLITELGSSFVKSLGFRDSWVFVGWKGNLTFSNNFEKHVKNNNAKNKYENWPELIELQGCISKYLE